MGAEWLDILFMPMGLGGRGVGKGPFETAADKKANKENDALQAAKNALPTPQAPDTAQAAETAETTIKKRRSAMTKTIYTSPLGAAGEADIARKTLLGQ